MRTFLICKLCSLDSVTSRSRDVNKHGGGVNDLNHFSLDDKNKYGRESAIFNFFKTNFEYGAIFKFLNLTLNMALFFKFFKPNFEYGAIFKFF